MLSKIANIWRDNHGSALTICGLLVALIMSIAWRFDLVPEIGPPLSQPTALYGVRAPVHPNILVVSIRSLDLREGNVILQVVGPPQTEGEQLSPIYSRTAKLQDGQAEFVVTQLSRGAFAAYAFVDLDDNQEFSMDKRGQPTEPYGFARLAGGSEPKQLAEGVFELSNEPVFIKFQLRTPSAGLPTTNKSDAK